MKLNIITPCIRTENLFYLGESINIPLDKYRWIIVVDKKEIPKKYPKNCEIYAYQEKGSMTGNAQRNYALNLIDDGHVYFLDDDTIMHNLLWKHINHLDTFDFLHFSQIWKNNGLRLKALNVSVGNIDSGCFIVSRELIGDRKWIVDRYDADGVFAEECFKNSKRALFIPKVLSIYNALRTT